MCGGGRRREGGRTLGVHSCSRASGDLAVGNFPNIHMYTYIDWGAQDAWSDVSQLMSCN